MVLVSVQDGSCEEGYQEDEEEKGWGSIVRVLEEVLCCTA